MRKTTIRKIMRRLRSTLPAESAAPARGFEPMEQRLLLSLLGIPFELPYMPYDSGGAMAYDAAADSFDMDATPLAFRVSPRAA